MKMKTMLGLLFGDRLWPLRAQLGDIDSVPAEAAAHPIVLRNSLLVLLLIHLPFIQQPGFMQEPQATKRGTC
jgi:hypothetical protein